MDMDKNVGIDYGSAEQAGWRGKTGKIGKIVKA